MKLVLASAIMFFGFSVMAQNTPSQKKNTTITKAKPAKATGKVTGSFKNMPSQTVVLQVLRANDVVTIVDSAHSDAAGHFELPVYATDAQLYRLQFSDRRFIFLSINKEKVKVEGDWNAFDSYTVAGSKASEEMEKFISNFRADMQHFNIISMAMDSLKRSGKDSLLNATAKELEQMKMSFTTSVKQTAEKTAYEPNAILAARLLNPPDAAFLASFNKGLSTRFPGTSVTKDFNEFYEKLTKGDKPPEIGDMAPEVALPAPDGTTVSLSSLKGHYVLLDFWASWCGPCRGENPNVVAAYKKFKDKNFTILGVSLDNNKEPWEKAINADGLTWAQVSELKGWSSAVAATYGIRSIPQNFLIDPSGKIIGHNLRGAELEQTLEHTLK